MLWCHWSGSMWSDGRISIGQCDLVESWDNLSLSQKKNLNYRYQMGCECRVSKDCSIFLHTYLGVSPLSHLSVLEVPTRASAREAKQASWAFSSLAPSQTFFSILEQKTFTWWLFSVKIQSSCLQRHWSNLFLAFTPAKLVFRAQGRLTLGTKMRRVHE